MRERVRKVAQEMNYEPNFAAKLLKQKQNNDLGLIVSDIPERIFGSGYFMPMISCFIRQCEELGLRCQIEYYDLTKAEKLPALLTNGLAGGVLHGGVISPALREWLTSALVTPWQADERLIADEHATIEATLKELADECGCCLIFTTGGTGPAPRDVTPEATRAVGERELPGFGEEMRRISRHFVPTAILSRQTAVTRGRCLIVNLPGQPKSIRETLEGVRQSDGTLHPEGLFAAIPYCVELLGGARLETNEAVIRAFRPKQK